MHARSRLRAPGRPQLPLERDRLPTLLLSDLACVHGRARDTLQHTLSHEGRELRPHMQQAAERLRTSLRKDLPQGRLVSARGRTLHAALQQGAPALLAQMQRALSPRDQLSGYGLPGAGDNPMQMRLQDSASQVHAEDVRVEHTGGVRELGLAAQRNAHVQEHRLELVPEDRGRQEEAGRARVRRGVFA